MSMNPTEVVEALAGEKPLGATLLYPQDRYPFVVVGATKSGKTIQIVPLEDVNLTTGHQPARFDGPWPVWDHTYSPDEIERFKRDVPPSSARWSEKRQRYMRAGYTPLSVGQANYYRNYSY